jgi:hypothetical protein
MFDLYAYLFVNMVIFIVDNFLNYFFKLKKLTIYIQKQVFSSFFLGSLKFIF